MRPDTWGRFRGLFLFSLALAIRLTVLLGQEYHRHGAETAHLEHRTIARNLAEGKGFVFAFFSHQEQPTSQQAPLVPATLAAAYLLFGVEAPAAFLAVLLAQALVSSATVVLLGRIAAGAFSNRDIGLATGVLAAFFPPLIVSSLHAQALVWNLFWMALMIEATYAIVAGRRRGAAQLGIASAGGMLTDPILGGVTLSLGLFIVVVAARSRAKTMVSALAVAATIAVIGVAPWMVRNARVHGRFVPIKDSFGYVFWQGNTRVSWGTDKLPVDATRAAALSSTWNVNAAMDKAFAARAVAVSVDSSLTREQLDEIAKLPTEVDRMKWFGRKIREELAAEPWLYGRQCVRRLVSWIWFDPTNPRSYLWQYRASYLLVAGLAILGLAHAFRSRAKLGPIVAAGFALTLTHVLIITSARFRIPFELLLLIPSGWPAWTLARLAKMAIAPTWSSRLRTFPF